MLLQICFIASCAFVVGQGFPLRDFHLTPWNNVELIHPISENTEKQANKNDLNSKDHEFAKINKGEAMTSELPNQSSGGPELPSGYVCTSTIRGNTSRDYSWFDCVWTNVFV